MTIGLWSRAVSAVVFSVLAPFVAGCHSATAERDASVDDASGAVDDLARADMGSADATSASDLGGGGVEIVAWDGGAKGFMLAGKPFVPIGTNYFNDVMAEYDGTAYKTFDTFDTQTFDLATIDSDFSSMSQHGFNYVRLWLKGVDTDNGFVAPGADGGYDADTFDKYATNIVATIHAAKKHGMLVVLTGSFPGPYKDGFVPSHYAPDPASLPLSSVVSGINRLLFIPALRDALAQFYSDLLAALVAQDPAIGSSIFYFDLYNELHYDLLSVPLSLSQPTDTFSYAGKTYQLSYFASDINDASYPLSRQALMDTAARDFVQELSARVREKIPGLLVTASSPYNYAFGHKTSFDGGALINVNPNDYMLRPFFELQAGADIIDIHNYPSTTFVSHATLALRSNEVFPVGATSALSTSVSAASAPLIAGELGAYTATYGVTSTTTPMQYATAVQAAVIQLQQTEQTAFCPYDFTGYGVWDWNVEGDTFVLVDPQNDVNGLFMQALAPTSIHDFCGAPITP